MMIIHLGKKFDFDISPFDWGFGFENKEYIWLAKWFIRFGPFCLLRKQEDGDNE